MKNIILRIIVNLNPKRVFILLCYKSVDFAKSLFQKKNFKRDFKVLHDF